MAFIDTDHNKNGKAVYRLRWRNPDGRVRTKSFARKQDAINEKRKIEYELQCGTFIDPKRGKVLLRDYSAEWVRTRKLEPRTRELYVGLLANHINPHLGDFPLHAIDTGRVRDWYTTVDSSGKGRTVAPKSYRLLRAIMATAHNEDGLIVRNPCRIKNYDKEPETRRPTVSVHEVYALADAVEPHRRALILTAAMTGLRLGELLGLQRRDLNPLLRKIDVARQVQELSDGSIEEKDQTKTKAGHRTFSLPDVLMPEITFHLDHFVGPEPTARVFTGQKGGDLRRGVWQKEWSAAREAIGRPELHFHDLRGFCENTTATSGATMYEFMTRLGQKDPDAAMRYLSVSEARDREIAQAFSDRIEADLRGPEEDPREIRASGTE